MRILLFGDENFTFANGFLVNHKNDEVEICSCLKENELKQETKNNINALNENLIIHYGINPVQLKAKFPPNSFDALYYILPGLSFHGHPEFIDPESEMFKLRLNLFCFSFLKSSKNIVKKDGYVYLLFPTGKCISSFSYLNENELQNMNHCLPFLPIEPNKLAKFCNIIREKNKDYNLDLSLHENWIPVLFNVSIVNEIPDWLKNCKYFCFRMTEIDNKNNKLKNDFNISGNNENENNMYQNDEKHEDDMNNENEERKRNDDEEEEDEENEKKDDERNEENVNEDENNDDFSDKKKKKEEKEEDPDEYNVLKIPPQVFDYPIEKLGHVNECFLFKLFSINSKSVLISRLTLKYDPRISGWKGDNKIKKDVMNPSMNMPMNMNMNVSGLNNINNMNNYMNMNKFKGNKFKGKIYKNDFQQQYKNNLIQNNVNYSINKKANISYPPPPPTNMNMQQNNMNIPNQNMNYKQQNNYGYINNFKNMSNNIPQNIQNMSNMPINVNSNMSNNMIKPYMNGNNNYNNNYRNNMYQQNVPIPPPINNYNNKKMYGNNNLKRKNDMYNVDNMDKNYDYNMKDNYKWDDDNYNEYMNRTNEGYDEYEIDNGYNNCMMQKNKHNNAEDADYYFIKQRAREPNEYGTY